MNLFEPQWDAELAANLYGLEPGALVSPLHFHHANEELLFVLAGEPTLRPGDDEETLEPGAVAAFPAGPDGVHQIRNRSDTPSRVLIVATAELPEVAEQPKAGRLAILTEDGLRIVPRGEPIQAP
jgi:uncharacterized cupin superfamily protein